MKKRITSMLLSIVMALSLLPQGIVLAAGNTPTIKASSTSALVGGTVSLDITIANNPGILGATLTLTYDEGLTLQNVKAGDAFSALTFTKPGKFTSPCNFVWDAQELEAEDIKDGVILTLTFKVADNATAGNILNVRLSCEDSNISDINLHSLHVATENGGIHIIDYIPGDVDSDGFVNTSDVIKMRRYLAGGYDLTIFEPAGNVNRDQYRNTTDVIWMRRFLAGGYTDPATGEPLMLWPEILDSQCEHTLKRIPAKPATSIEAGNYEYWHCSKCGRYFSDAEAKKEITLAETIDPATGDHSVYSIQYRPGMIDNYDPVEVAKVQNDTYTSGETKALPTLKMDTYTFVGWSDQNGNFYGNGVIPAGTAGDLILQDHWISQRNRAVAKSKLDDPLILEDLDQQQILFCYEIGTIENVPLYTTQELNCVNGIITIQSQTVEHQISNQEMKTVGSSVSKETAESTQFTLSKELTDQTEVSKDYIRQTGRDEQLSETQARSQSSTQSVSVDSGGSNERYEYNNYTQRNTENDSYVLNNNLDTGVSFELKTGIKNTTELSAGLSFPLNEIIDANVGAKNTTELSLEMDTKTNLDYSVGSTQTWERETFTEGQQANSTTATKSWNTNVSRSTSAEVSSSETISNALHEMVSETYHYGDSYTVSNAGSSAHGNTSSTGETQEVSNTVVFTKQEIKSKTTGYQTTGHTFGNYRLIMAGTMHVFAVVGYDIANDDYYTYTYSVMGDGSASTNGKSDGWHEIIDYSYDRSFSDYENSVLPFSVPAYVEDYVNSRIMRTEGLGYIFNNRNHTATVCSYEGTDSVVFVPSYIVDEEGTAFRVTAIETDVFKNNSDIQAVSLGRYISEIPNSAFEGCTTLQYVICPAVTKIGNRAFFGCTSMTEFKLSKQITYLGTDAFVNVPSVVAELGCDPGKVDSTDAMALVSTLAQNTANCGAKEVILDLSYEYLPENLPLPLTVDRGDSFTMKCGGKDYSDLSLESHAKKTRLERVDLSMCKGIPLTLYSEQVELYAVDIENCNSYVMTLWSEKVALSLSGTNRFVTSHNTAIVCQSFNVTYSNSGLLYVNGDVRYCGSIVDPSQRVKFQRGQYESISKEEYNNIIKGAFTITFDPNGGITTITSKTVYSGMPVGNLPTAVRNNYTFDGWFLSDGTHITEDSIISDSTGQTLYAHWSPIYVTSLQVETPASKTTFYEGDQFSANGLQMLATYNDGTTKTVSASECTISSPDMIGAGTKAVSVTYGGVSASYSITVNALTISLSCNTSTASSGYVTFSANVPCGVVTWSSSNSGVASIDSTGKATFGNTMSSTTITAVVDNNGYTKSATKTLSLSNTGGTKYKETFSTSYSTVTYGTHPAGYSPNLPVKTGSIPSYTTDSSSITETTTNTSTGKIVTSYKNEGVAGYIYYQFNYNSSTGGDNIYKIINYQESYRNCYIGDGTTPSYAFYCSPYGRQFYSTTNYPEHDASANWTKYASNWWAYQDKQAGHTWYVATGISGALAGSWYRFPLYNYSKTTTTYTYYYYSIS